MSSPALSFTVEVRPDLLPDDQREAVLANPGFGKTFTDHMVLATWTTDQGWHSLEPDWDFSRKSFVRLVIIGANLGGDSKTRRYR